MGDKTMKKNRILIGSCIAIFLIGIAGSIYLLLAPHGTQVNIIQDGTVLYCIDLAEADDQTIEVEYEGRVNIIQIENGQIRVSDADCPDQICVHMGWLSSGGIPIVCLPNHLVIEFSEPEDDVDAGIR